jgi:hypothetical protein
MRRRKHEYDAGRAAAGGNPLRVIGVVLKDPISGQPVFVARSVTELTN